MRGIVLAGGVGSRLYPMTKSINKQLLPIYNKPMIYYPLSILMLANIREILIISTTQSLSTFKDMFKDGSSLGLELSYIAQESPNGIVEAFILGEKFIKDDEVCLILGDNIFYGNGLIELLLKSINDVKDRVRANIFGYYVNEPERYGVVEFNSSKDVVSIEEKPKEPRSNYAVVGLYIYPNDVLEKAKRVEPSDRGELEITTLNQIYLRENRLKVELLGRGFTWLDTGTYESLFEASAFIQTIEHRQNLKVACIEEIAYKMGYISKEALLELAKSIKNSDYGQYLISIANEGV